MNGEPSPPVSTIEEPSKSSSRRRADDIKPHRCRNLIAVIENPDDVQNIGTVIRNVNALGVDKVYVVDERGALPADWEAMRTAKSLTRTSVAAVRWSFVKRFDNTGQCLRHLEAAGFVWMVTSPHRKGKTNSILHEQDYTRHKKLAIWFGNERHGISDLAVERSEMCVTVPMFGMVESLNLATTSGIVLHEIARQRRDYQQRLLGRRAEKRMAKAS